MSNNSKTISDSTTFIDLRNEVIAELCEIEESIYNANGEIDSLERKINRLYSIALELENEYFILRLQTIQNQFRKFRSKKGYRQLEFDRLFKLLEKLKDTDTVDFLNSAIKNRIDRIAKGVANKKVFRKVEPSELRENKFIVYTFQKLFFVVKSF
ncbi:MAG: hypothetical protein KDK36_07890, partial [Leptospiraceae bacterium]|nr:hypothetical protein [Leptospiraceae bacterium]